MRFDSHHASALDTLRLNRSQQHELQQQLLRRKRTQTVSEARREPRFEYDVASGLIIEVFHPGGTNTNYLVKPRNLSCHGIGFLHGSFLHSGTECHVWIRSTDGQLKCIPGTVCRCQWICGRVHEIGVLFDEAIILEEYLKPQTESSDDAPVSMPLPAIEGRLLYASNDERAQATIIPIQGVGLDAQVVATAEQAVERLAAAAIDVALVDMTGGTDASNLMITALREAGFDGPLFAITDCGDEGSVQALQQAGATAVLTRPLTCETFIQALETPQDQLAAATDHATEHPRDKPDSRSAAAVVDPTRLRGIMQAVLLRIREYVKKIWERFTRMAS